MVNQFNHSRDPVEERADDRDDFVTQFFLQATEVSHFLGMERGSVHLPWTCADPSPDVWPPYLGIGTHLLAVLFRKHFFSVADQAQQTIAVIGIQFDPKTFLDEVLQRVEVRVAALNRDGRLLDRS
jgi:hypothetical protein